MEVFLKGKKRKKGGAGAFSFPPTQAELTDDVIEDCGMRRALTRFGKELARQMVKRGVVCQTREKKVLGVTLISINFNLLLEPTPKED